MKNALKSGPFALVTWVLLLVAVPTGLYVSHVYDQLAEVRANNLRTLSKAADSTRTILTLTLKNVRNLRNESFICDFVSRQPYLDWGADGRCPDPKGPEEQQGAIFAYAHLHGETSGVQIWAGFSSDIQKPDKDRSKVEETLPDYRFHVNLHALLEAVPFDDALDMLIIANENGTVVHQHRSDERLETRLLISSLHELPASNPKNEIDRDDLKRASSSSRVNITGTDYQLLCQPLTLEAEERNGSSPGEPTASEADFGDHTWLLCGLVSSDRSIRQSLAVAPFLAFGFFAVTVFGFLTWPAIKLLWMSNRDRLSFSDLSFLLFGTFGALMLATILVLGIGSYFQLVEKSEESLKQLAYQVEQNLQAEIGRLTKGLSHFDEAIRSYDGENVTQLYAPAPGIRESQHVWDEARGGGGNWSVDSDLKMLFWMDCDGMQTLKATIQESNTPMVQLGHRDYVQAALNDRLWKNPKPDDVDWIPRFVDPVRSVTTGKFGTVISIRSPVQRDNDSDTSPTGEDKPGRIRHDCVAAIEADLIATTKPVLPPGVGFAVIDDNGKVIFHSDERRALFENLYEEMDDGDRLQSIVESRTEHRMDSTYLGLPHQVYVKPLMELPWTVVTFADFEIISTTNLEILGHAIVLAFSCLLIYALLALLYFILRGPEIPRWLLPGSHNNRVVGWFFGIPIMAIAAMLLLKIFASSDIVLVAAAALPVAVFAAIYFASARSFSKNKHDAKTNTDNDDDPSDVKPQQVTSSIWSSFLVWIAIAAVPAFLFFDSAADHQAAILVRYENEHLADQMVQRNCAIEDYYRDVYIKEYCDTLPDTDSCWYDKRHKLIAGDIYPSFMFWPPRKDQEANLGIGERIQNCDSLGQCEDVEFDNAPKTDPDDSGAVPAESSSIWQWFAANTPLYNTTVIGSRYLNPNSENGSAKNFQWSWNPNAAAGPFRFAAVGLACGTQFSVRSGSPLNSGMYFRPSVWFFGGLFLLGLYYWTRYGARRLFFGDLRKPPLEDIDSVEKMLEDNRSDAADRVLAITTSQADRSRLLDYGRSKNSAGDDGDDAPTAGRSHKPHDMMSYLAGMTRRDKLLEDLEQEIDDGSNILIVSPVDPYSLLVEDEAAAPANDDEAADPTASTVIQEQRQIEERLFRWRQVLARFRVVVVSVNASPPPSRSSAIWQRELDKAVDPGWLESELFAVPELEPLLDHLTRELDQSTRRNALDRIVERAFGSYMAIWDACSEEEKLVLVQLANEHVVNPKQIAIVRRLIQRGLLVRDPRMRIMNQSFARFITQAQDPAEVKIWERKAAGLSWVHTRWALFGILLLGLLFLWATQRELFNTSITFFSAAALGLPGLIRVISNLSKVGNN